MKKALALILSLLLLLPLTASAAPSAVSFSGALFDFTQSSGGVQYRDAPRNAFNTDDDSLIAGVPDGSRLILADAWGNLELWDEAAGRRLPFAFSLPEEADYAASLCELAGAMRLKKDQREEYLEKQRIRKAEYLAGRGLDSFETVTQIVECFGGGFSFGRTRCMELSERYAILYHPTIGGLIADMQSASVRLLPQGASMLSLCGNQLLYCDAAGKGAVIDLASGEETAVDLLTGASGAVVSVAVVRLFPDGGKAVVGRSNMEKDEETGRLIETEYYVMNAGAVGAVCVELGRLQSTQAPNRLLITEDGLFALAYNTSSVRYSGAFLVDLTSRSVSAVTGLLPVAGLESAFLCYDFDASGFGNNYLCTLDPNTLAKTGLTGAGSREMFTVSPFMEAVYAFGRLYSQSDRLRGYFTVE